MMRLLAAVLILLFSSSVSAEQADDSASDIMWQIRPPEFIARLAATYDLGPRRRGLAWWGPEFCIIMTPPPPIETAPETVIRRYIWLLNHELRHCREKRNFHR